MPETKTPQVLFIKSSGSVTQKFRFDWVRVQDELNKVFFEAQYIPLSWFIKVMFDVACKKEYIYTVK
ncbi:MAG: hypothetical protein R2821_08505 [Flavobacteriaceae bacterium]